MTTTEKKLNGIRYSLHDDGTKKWAVIIDARPCRTQNNEVVIPHDIDGYIVVGVANFAFRFIANSWIETITFNSPIKRIYEGAFSGFLLKLRTVNFLAKQGTPQFDLECFEDCDELADIFWENHNRFGKVRLSRNRGGKLFDKDKKILHSVLLKSEKKAFIGCFKMPTELEKH